MLRKVADLFRTIGQKQAENRQAILTDLRDVITRAALAEIEDKPLKLTNQQLDVVLSLCEAEQLTAEDFQANVAARVRCIKATELKNTYPGKAAEAERQEAEVKKFAEWLWQQHNENLKKHRELDLAAAAALSVALSALSADQGIANNTAPPNEEEVRLTGEREAIVEQIATLNGKLSQSRPW